MLCLWERVFNVQTEKCFTVAEKELQTILNIGENLVNCQQIYIRVTGRQSVAFVGETKGD